MQHKLRWRSGPGSTVPAPANARQNTVDAPCVDRRNTVDGSPVPGLVVRPGFASLLLQSIHLRAGGSCEHMGAAYRKMLR